MTIAGDTVRFSRLFDGLGADLWLGLRLLGRYPGVTVAAILALALAIGANVTVFTLANAFLFKNLPFDDSDRILYISSTNTARPGSSRGMSYPDFVDIRTQVASLDGLGALSSGSVDLSDTARLPERYRCAFLTAGGFAVIGQWPVRGRDFMPDDERPGATPVAILGNALWQGRYSSDPSVVGRTIRIDGVPTAVVGVMPAGVTFPGASDLWMPLVRTAALDRRDSRRLTLFGRLKKGASLASARSELTTIASRLAAEYPATNKDIGVLVQNFNDRFSGGETPRLLVWLMWAVGFVLVIACANVASLLLARAVDRTREVSIRASLGASRWRVIRQLLVESLLLALLGAGFGWILGVWGVRIFDAALVPAVKPPYIDFSIDYRVLAYLATITIGTGVLFGLAPALHLSRLDLSTALKEGGNAAGRGRRATAVSFALVVTEVSLAVVLLAGAGLMIRSLLNTYRADIGVKPDNILSMTMSLRASRYPRLEDQVHFYDRLEARLEALPGVETAAVASDLPAESPDVFAYETDLAAPTEDANRPRTSGLIVGEDYFRAMGVPPRAGRAFAAADADGSLPVAIVNQALVAESWPGADPLGRRLRFLERPDGAPRGAPLAPGPWLTVVGVVPDILQDDESFEISPTVYVPFRQRPQSGMEMIVRTRVPPATLGDPIRQAVRSLDDDMAVRSLRSLEESLWFRNWRYRIFGTMFGIFAAIALVLASTGLYAVIAHSVSQRTREIGVRMTLGASPGRILRLVFTQGMVQLATGLALGLAGALATTNVLRAMLVGITSADPWTFAGVSLVLALACALGCAIPARRAMRVDPLVVLKQ